MQIGELYAVKRWVHVDEEGPSEKFFDDSAVVEAGPEAEDDGELENALEEVIERVDNDGVQALDDDDHHLIRLHAEVDDDHEPAPENIPRSTTGTPYATGQHWGHDGICPRRERGQNNTRPQLPNVERDVRPSLVKLFELLFPVWFIKNVMLPEMNKTLQPAVTYGEFLRWLGLWFLMATIHGPQRREFWSTSTDQRVRRRSVSSEQVHVSLPL